MEGGDLPTPFRPQTENQGNYNRLADAQASGNAITAGHMLRKALGEDGEMSTLSEQCLNSPTATPDGIDRRKSALSHSRRRDPFDSSSYSSSEHLYSRDREHNVDKKMQGEYLEMDELRNAFQNSVPNSEKKRRNR